MAHNDGDHPDVDLWLAEDLEKGVWAKQPSTDYGYPPAFVDGHLKLLKKLEDGRVVYSAPVSWGCGWQTRIFDPKTNQSEDVPQLGACNVIGIYE